MKKHTKRTIRDPLACINKRMKLADDQTRDIGLAYHIALDALLGDLGSESARNTLACSMNVALLLSEQGIHAEAQPIIKIAQEALMQMHRMSKNNGEWKINLPHHMKQAILAAINAHDEQIGQCTRAQITNALREVHHRITTGEVFA